jgi:protein-tyrosine phosphatase
MAEGFAPANPEQLDAHLSYLVSKYTMHGHNALVHCRGGVGRAGLFACAWMIKMGLLGPVSGIHDPAGRQLDNEMRIVEKVIEVIRKRRSAKAIETPQQVHFILQYIHWLSNHAKVLTGREALELQPVKPDPIPGS